MKSNSNYDYNYQSYKNLDCLIFSDIGDYIIANLKTDFNLNS